MTPSTKSVQIQIKSHCDVFHELWKANPHQVPSLRPTTIQNCQVLEGEPRTVGCVILWHYFHDGKDRLFKSLTEEIDEGKKWVTFKIVKSLREKMELWVVFSFGTIFMMENIVFFKSLTEGINEGKKWVTFKGLEGDMLELYKTFDVHIHVDTDGPNNLVTWTVEYEKRDPNDSDPETLMEFYKTSPKT